MYDRLVFLAKRITERLWVRPLAVSVVSVLAVLGANLADRVMLAWLPDVTQTSLESILSIMAASMLVIATFAVASMVSAYASSASSATPRSFRLVVADDVSQNALSTFIGAFIFSIIALIASKNDVFLAGGRAVLFLLTITVFGLVVITFVRWVDRIARLGRLVTSIEKVEKAASDALRRRMLRPHLGGVAAAPGRPTGQAIHAARVGYVQRVDMARLQGCAEKAQGRITVAALPGTFAMHGRPLAYVQAPAHASPEVEASIQRAFKIGAERLFDEDPRFGLVVASEIAGKALSPGINDPGTAIAVLGTFARLFTQWAEPVDAEAPEFDRVEVPTLAIADMFDDAFTAIARDGAGVVEVVVRLQKVLACLASLDDPAMQASATEHGRRALARAESALTLPEDKEQVRLAGRRYEA